MIDIKYTEVIPEQYLFEVVVKEIKPIFENNYPDLIELWETDIKANGKTDSPSLKKIIDELMVGSLKGLTIKLIRTNIEFYHDYFVRVVKECMDLEQEKLDQQRIVKQEKANRLAVVESDTNIEVPNEIIIPPSTTVPGNMDPTQLSLDIDDNSNQKYAYVPNEPFVKQLRKIVASPDQYTPSEKGENILENRILNARGELQAIAEIGMAGMNLFEHRNGSEAEFWDNLRLAAANHLDEWTADLFDIITFLWKFQEKGTDDYINFHSDDALFFKYGLEQRFNDDFQIRERERFALMARVVAMNSIYISVDGDKIELLNDEDKNNNEYDFKYFVPLFEIGTIQYAYSKRTGKPIGIYALSIKPAEIIRKFLTSLTVSFSTLDVEIFKYNYDTQSAYKRIARELSDIWKQRSGSQKKLNQPFKVKTLLKYAKFPKRSKGVDLKSNLELILDDYKEKKIIEDWEYKTTIDENLVGKRGWVKVWEECVISIVPPEALIVENKKNVLELPKLDRNEKNHIVNSQSVKSTENIGDKWATRTELMCVHIKRIKEEKKLSYRKLGEEIGISHVTVRRIFVESNKGIHFKTGIAEKIEKWLDLNEVDKSNWPSK